MKFKTLWDSWFQVKIAHSTRLLILLVASSQPKVSASGTSSEFAWPILVRLLRCWSLQTFFQNPNFLLQGNQVRNKVWLTSMCLFSLFFVGIKHRVACYCFWVYHKESWAQGDIGWSITLLVSEIWNWTNQQSCSKWRNGRAVEVRSSKDPWAIEKLCTEICVGMSCKVI